MFELHPRLAEDSSYLGDLPLCAVLLAKDANYPWFILVPRVPGITEIYQLDEAQREALMGESCAFAQRLQRAFAADKLNVAALGNMVPQLHLHHIARYQSDAAWPGPVWGAVPARAYPADERRAVIEKMSAALAGLPFTPRRADD